MGNHRMIASRSIAATIAFVSHVALAHVCPISECDYGDPLYQAAYAKFKIDFDVYNRCIEPPVNSFLRATEGLAILYPRFGIAYRAMQDEIKAATDNNNPPNDASAEAEQKRINEARQRFEDRILRTAEHEALELYNLYQLNVRQQTSRCGPMPSLPRPPAKSD